MPDAAHVIFQMGALVPFLYRPSEISEMTLQKKSSGLLGSGLHKIGHDHAGAFARQRRGKSTEHFLTSVVKIYWMAVRAAVTYQLCTWGLARYPKIAARLCSEASSLCGLIGNDMRRWTFPQ